MAVHHKQVFIAAGLDGEVADPAAITNGNQRSLLGLPLVERTRNAYFLGIRF